jgi:4-hydroxyphenylpyruvate dioxygenase
VLVNKQADFDASNNFMKIDHVHFYTRNAARTRDWFIHNVGFKAIGNCITQHTHTELIALNSAFLVLSSPLNSASPVAQYLKSHPSGVVDIAFRVKDLSIIVDRARYLGVKLLQNIQLWRSQRGSFKYAKIIGWNSLQHTLIEAGDRMSYCLPNFKFKQYNTSKGYESKITNIDHVVLNVAHGKLDAAVKLYQALFNFQVQQSFEIKTNKSGLSSQALIDEAGKVQFNINEPTASNSQIQEFIDLNHGSGIQHLALRTSNLIADVEKMQQRGLKFLTVPPAYYSQLESLPLNLRQRQGIADLQILVDRDCSLPQALLMQIFTQPIFEQPTFFLEFIERRQEAKGFGGGNFKALFEAVEREQDKRFSQVRR